jgi:PKD domain
MARSAPTVVRNRLCRASCLPTISLRVVHFRSRVGRVPRRPRSLLAACLGAIVVGLLAPPVGRAATLLSFTWTPPSPYTGEVVTFSSPYDNPQHWDLDGDGNCDDASGKTAQRSFAVAGVYRIKLCVGSPVQATFNEDVTVLDRPPVAAFTYMPLAPVAGEPIVLTSTSSDPDGPITSLFWDLDGDGAFDDAAGTTASLTFFAAGTYPVALQVTDREGASAVASVSLAVAKPPPKVFAFSPIVRIVATVRREGTRVRLLSVNAPAGAQVTIRCRGRGCRFRRLTRSASSHRRVSAARLVKVRRLRHRLLRPGAVLSVRITEPDTIGKYTSFKIRRAKPPRRTDRCLVPGSTKPVRCPPS